MAFFDDKNLLVLGGAYGGLCIRADATYEHGQEYRHIGKELVLKKADGVKISVILPVYNVEPWIGECIESLKKQKQEGLEFIFVDDCGTDNSMKIVESWAEEDERVRIIRNRENIGSGPSRNMGIEAARGEYLSFIDPDDFVSDDFYESLYSMAISKGCDIIKGVRKFIAEDGSPLESHGIDLNDRIRTYRKKNISIMYSFNYEHQTAIFSRSLLCDKAVRYGSTRNAEDSTFLLKVCSKTESIETSDIPIYYYRQRTGAATEDYSLSRAREEMKALKEKADFLQSRQLAGDTVEYITRLMGNILSLFYYATCARSTSLRETADFQRGIQEIADIVGKNKKDFSMRPELEVFLNYSFAIPVRKRANDRLFHERIEQWNEFFIVRPQHVEPKYIKAYIESLHEMIKYAKLSGDKRVVKREGSFARKLFFRLSIKQRKQIINRLVREYIRSMINHLQSAPEN